VQKGDYKRVCSTYAQCSYEQKPTSLNIVESTRLWWLKTVKFDTDESGWLTVLKGYQIVAMQTLWELPKGKVGSSRDIWVQTNVALDGNSTISRASIINFLNAMVDVGVLSYHEITGKGGHRRIYAPMFDEAGTKAYLANMFIQKMHAEWPAATREAIKNL